MSGCTSQCNQERSCDCVDMNLQARIAKAKSDYEARLAEIQVMDAIQELAETPPVVEVVAEVNHEPVFALTGVMTKQVVCPHARLLIQVIADRFEVSAETAAEWLDATDFTTYY